MAAENEIEARQEIGGSGHNADTEMKSELGSGSIYSFVGDRCES